MENPDIKIINGHEHVRYAKETYQGPELLERSTAYYQWLDTRRTVRHFTDQPVPRQVIENIIMSASTAPSGAHKQPWTFCAISNPELKQQIRQAAEEEEYESYTRRMSQEWLDDLKPMATNHEKPFLTICPWLIAVFKKVYDTEEGEKKNNYYVNESVGLACGMLLTAIHNAGLAAVTHTPSPMNFLHKILERPVNERAFLLVPVGYPAADTYVPKLNRAPFEKIGAWYE